jgi:hypothetical protein
VLPNIVAKQHPTAFHQWGILVWPGDDRELAVPTGRDEHPTRAEHAQAGGIELLLQLVQTAEIAVDRGLQITLRLARVLGHDLPEHGVVGMSAAVVAYGRADRLREFSELGKHLLERHPGHLRVILQSVVQIIDIGRVVAVVVDLHRLSVDMRLEAVGGIAERLKRERAGGGLGLTAIRHHAS